MTDKEKYLIYCKENPDIPLFYQPEWQDVVTSGSWDIVCVYDQKGDICAFMPLHQINKFGIKALTNPVLSPYQGIYFPYLHTFEKEQKKQSFIFKSTNEMIKKLGEFTFFKVRFHPDFKMWLPFYFQGYKQTTYYSYILQHIKDHDHIFQGFKSNTKNIIRKAEKNIQVVESDDVDLLYDLLLKTFHKKNANPPFTIDFLRNLNDTLKQNRTLLFAKDESGQVHAGMFLAFDTKCAYNLLFGTDFQFVHSGAPSLLIWEAIKKASQRVDTFDFEGSRLPTIQPFFQSFGGLPTPYFEITKAKNKFWQTIFSIFRKM